MNTKKTLQIAFDFLKYYNSVTKLDFFVPNCTGTGT